MNMTFDKFFTKGEPKNQTRSKTVEKEKRKSDTTSKSPPPVERPPTNPKEKGTARLLLIQKDLSLNIKSKNIMDPKILEEWANETLIEVERLDNRNDGIPVEKKNPLKRFGIDRQSLEGMGLSKESITRLFRCMFVYSAGFYEMLHDMFEHSPKKFNLVGSVWKVFWILLEYCYKADHQTIIEEVNRENNEHLSRVSRELQKKTKELEDLIKWKETYLENYEKTTETLMMEKENLMREKVRLEEDCKINEKAYTDEVQLRIKFENKINDFYANYRDLQAKNGRILEELVNLQKKNEEQSTHMLELKQRLNQSNDRNAELTNMVKSFQEKLADKENLLDEVQKEKSEIEKRLIQAMKANQEIDKRKLQTEVDNQKFKAGSLASVNQMYQRNIEELKLVIQNKDDEIRQAAQKYKNLEGHYEEKNKQNLENEREMIKYRNLSQMLEEKVANQKKDLDKLNEKYEVLFKGHSEIYHSLISTEEKSKTLLSDREEALKNIDKLSEARRDLEHKYDKSKEELDLVLKGIGDMQKQIELLNEQKLKLEAFITEQKDRLVDQQNEINKKKSEIQHYKEDIHNLEEHHKEVLRKEKETIESWTAKYEKEQLRSANLAEKIINLESKVVLEINEKEDYKIKVYELEKKIQTQEAIVAEVKASVSEHIKQKELYEREYKLAKNLLDSSKIEYNNNIQALKQELVKSKLGFEDYYHPMVVEEILSRMYEEQQKTKELEVKLIEEVQRNTNQNYRAAKKNLIIHKFEKLCKSLIEERKILVKEREDLLHECLKFKNREKALKQQIENFMMTTRELKQELILSDARVRQFELEKLAQDEGRSPAKLKEAEEKKTIKKMREQIINILKSDITVKKAARPKSEERLPKEKASSAKVSTSNLRANTQPEENESRKKKQRYSLQDMKPNPNFKIRRTSLLLNKTMDDGFKNDNDKSRNEETDAYALIEELFSQKLNVEQILELAKQHTFNSGAIENIDSFFSNIRNAIDTEQTGTDMLDINSSVEANNDFGTVESRSKGQSITIPGKIKRTKPIMAKKRSENSSPDYSMQNSGSPVSHVAKTSMITPPPKIRTRGVTTNAKPEKFKIENAEANKSEKQSDHDSSISSSVQHSHVLDTTKNEMGYNIPLSKLDSPERKLIKPISLGDSGRNEKSNRSKDKSGRGSIEYSSGTEALKIDNRVNTDGSKFDEPSHTIDPTKAYADIDHITEETPKQSKKSVDPDNISSKNLSIDNQNSKSDNSLGARKSVSNVDPRFDIPKLPLSKKSSVVSSKRPSQTYVEDKKSPAAFTFNYEEVKMESSFDQGYKNQTKLISPVISVSNEQSQIIDKNNVRSAHASSGRKSIDIGIDEKQMAQQLGETQDLEKLTQALSKHTVPNKKAPNQPILIDIKALVDSLKNKNQSKTSSQRPSTVSESSGPKEPLFPGQGIRKLIQISKYHNA